MAGQGKEVVTVLAGCEVLDRTGLSPEWDRGFDEEFTDLVSADEEFVRAEFDALIAASWPPPAPPAAPGPVPGPTAPNVELPMSSVRDGLAGASPDDGCQRSPPDPVTS